MTAWDKKYVTDVESSLQDLENLVQYCDSNVLDKVIVVKSNIQMLYDNSDQDVDDLITDRKFESRLINLSRQFRKECKCSKK